MKQPVKPRPSLMKKARKAGELLQSGMPLKQVAKKVKCGTETLQGWLAYFKWELPTPPAPITSKYAIQKQAREQKLKIKAEQCSQVKNMLEAGSKQPVVRKALKLSYFPFNRYLKQLDILPDSVVLSNNIEKARQFYELADMLPNAIDQELRLLLGTAKKWVSEYKWTNDQPTMIDLRQQAQKLYENKGFQQIEISEQLGVSEKSIGIWKEKGQWKKLLLENSLQQKARLLYEQGKEQKEIAKETGISEKSIGRWKKLFKWQVKPLNNV